MALHRSKATPGLFASTAPARQAAQRCKDDGYLRVLSSETKGKTVKEVCTITEKGLAYLLSQASPKHVLEDLVRALEARQSQLAELVATARQWQASFDALKATAEKVLTQVQSPKSSAPCGSTANGCETWTGAVLSQLAHWRDSEAMEDYPLPDLYRQAQQASPGLTIGHFHDGLRGLYDQGQIYLHPWTGPLYEIPEPPYALLIGHEIAYYASRR
jgi:hypothetical protein